MILAGTTTIVSITLIPSYRDGDGYPADVTYSFDVNFISSCPPVISIIFATETSD